MNIFTYSPRISILTLCLGLLTLLGWQQSAWFKAEAFNPTSAIAVSGAALNFDGTNDYVNLGTGLSSVFNGTNKITIQAWVYPTAFGGLKSVISNLNISGGTPTYWMRMNDEGKMQFSLETTSGGVTVTTGAALSLNAWKHITATWDGSTIRIYVNGVLDGSEAQSGSFPTSSNTVTLGISYFDTTQEQWQGALDEVRVWNRALCEAEILARYNCELTGTETGLLAYYKFNQGMASADNSGVTTLTDSSPNGRNGTLSGFALTGATSNWIEPGGVTSGNSCAPLLLPQIDVKGLGVSIASGDTTPSAMDDTDFGITPVTGGTVAHTFTIENNGGAALNVTSITSSGANSGDFMLGALTPASPIPAGSSATFTVTFDPNATGPRTATIGIASNDCDSSPYTFAVQGTGLMNTPPTITAALGVTRSAGAAVSNSQIATVNDAEDAENTLAVMVNNAAMATVNGVTVSNLAVDDGGEVTANVVANCLATTAMFTLKVTDSGGAMATATLTVTVTPTSIPTVSAPANQSVLAGGTASFSVMTTNATSVQWQVSTDGGANFTDIPLATGNTLTLNNVTAAMNGQRYRAIASNSCGTATSTSALLVVNAAGAKFDDPLVCLVGGDTGIITAFITNNGAAAVNASYSATNLAPNLIGIPGSGVASVAPANFVITPTTANWTGVLQPGETVNLLFRVQFAPGLLNGAQICFDAIFVIDGNQAQQQICTILNCPVGGINPAVNAQKPASLLVFPYYTSKAATKADTRFTISNLGTQTAFIHAFFIDGASCQPTDQFLCLTAGASYAGKASETDGETTGWILALAVNQQGVPTQFNHLIGNAFVNDGEYVGGYAAEGFAARSANLAAIQGTTALLFLDGIGYDAVPNLFATEVQSPMNAPNQRVVTVGLRGDLNASAMTGAAQVGTGLVINGNESPLGSFTTWLSGSCQAIATITNTNPRVPTGMNGMIPSGQNGTLQFKIGAGVGLLMTPRSAPWRGIRALHKIGLTTSTIRLPLIPPGC